MTRLGVALAPSKQIDLAAVVDLALQAERLGYDSVWVPETWGADAVSLLALLAVRTSTIRLASGVLNVYSRSAALIAQTAATLQELSGGRFILGLGSSGPIVVERWHGVPFDRPLARTREYVSVIRTALRGEEVRYEGDILQLRDFKLLNPPPTCPPIYIAALGPRNVRLTGEIADGWLPIFAPIGRLDGLIAELRRGEGAAGRSPGSVEVAAYLPALVGSRGSRLLCQQLAYYVGGMGTFYAGFLRARGFGEETEAIRGRWQAGDRVGAVELVGPDLLASATLGDDPEVGRGRLNQARAQGVSLPIVAVPHGSRPDEVAATLQAFRPGYGAL